MIRIPLIFFVSLLSFSSSAQKDFASFQPDPAREKAWKAAITLRFQQDVNSLSGPNKKYISDIFRERYELITRMFDDHAIVEDAEASAYLSELAGEILRANPGLPAPELRILFSKAWWANASSMGEGTILFNIGLFHRLDNESQAAFVLCHELAHYYLNHGNNSILNYVNTVYSAGFQKQLKTIQHTGYQQNRMLEDLARNLTFRSRRHSRASEQAADSMAVELMKNTRFDLKQALTCLALLDSADRDKYPYPLQLATRFNFPSFAFRSSWTGSGNSLFAVAGKEEALPEDSLKTHPDCAERIEKLRPAVARYDHPGTRAFPISESRFRYYRERFDYEILNYCFENGEVSRCLCYALEMVDHAGNQTYLHALIGRCWNELYAKQKAHGLGKIVDLPGPEFPEEYNQLLRLIQNARLQDLAALSYYYLQQYEQAEGSDPLFASVWQTARENFKNQ